jgi:hypothetical protein
MDLSTGSWMNTPKQSEISDDVITIITEPHTDLWQRTYYGFRNDNAPAFLFEKDENFTFTLKAQFEYKNRFDQCGVVIYNDSGNWFKAAIEREDEDLSRLGSVVTNHGYSDWATTDIAPAREIWYRLSRRGPDFLIESSENGEVFHQMRIFHLHTLGVTTEALGKLNPPAVPDTPVKFGLYACSPLDSSFRAVFSNMDIEKCRWLAHK